MVELSWEQSESFDIHVLRNNQASVGLEQFVRVLVSHNVQIGGQPKERVSSFKAGDLRANPSQLSILEAIAYIPSWVENNTFPATVIHQKNGIQVDGTTGKITAGLVPAGSLHTITSFGVRVVMFLSDPAPHTVQEVKLQVLVHVHNSITKAWVTPGLFHARPDVIKGIERMRLGILSTEQIKRITLFKDASFSEPMAPDLALENDPFDFEPYASNFSIEFHSVELLTNWLFFKDSRVFYDPISIQVSYVASSRITNLTLPLHLWHLNKENDVIKDESGNDLFKIEFILEKFQYRPSLYVSFDDGTVGDVTFWHDVSWEAGAGVSSDDIKFDDTGAFKVLASAVNKTLKVKAKLPPRLPFNSPVDITGDIKVDPSWLQTDLVAKPVPKSPVHPLTDEPVNILFISEGFDDETKFSNMVRDLCEKLRDDSKTAPWNYLFKSAINTWMLFEKSDERAATILYETVAVKEVKLLNRDKVDLALPLLDLIILGPKLSDKVSFFDLVAKVGVPAPLDDGKSKAQKIADWKDLFSPTIDSGDWVVSNAVFEYWKKLGEKRTLVEEKNTAFGICCGSKPALEPRVDSRGITLNYKSRLDYQHIIQMLSRIRANNNTGDFIGEKFWGRDKTGKMGKDFGLIVFLADGMIESGARLGGRYYPIGEVNKAIAAGMASDNYVLLKFFAENLNRTLAFFKWKNAAQAPAIELVPFDNKELSITVFATVAHELAHFFNLNDEYAVRGKKDAPKFHYLPKIYNLQHHDDLLLNDKISGDKVKWRWPRISKAGILALDPAVDQPVAGQVTVTLKAGHTKAFKKDQEIHLRQKNILQFTLDKLISPKLRIVQVDGDKLILAPLATAAFAWADFKQGSLAVLLTKASTRTEDNPTQDEYAELMSSMIRKRINDSNRTLTKEPCEENFDDIQKPVNIPGVLSDPSDRSKVVGLYAGGSEYSCKIYHPTGQCLMRSHTSPELTKKTTRVFDVFITESVFTPKIFPFCHVCRYSLVDQIDPTKHAEIDTLYGKDYPDTSLYSRNKVLFWVIVIAILAGGIGYGLYRSKDEKEPGEP